MGLIALFHLRLLLLGRSRLVVDAEILVVERGIHIFEPEVAGRDLDIAERGGFLDRGRVAPGPAEIEDSRGGAAIAFGLHLGSGRHGVQSASPNEAVLAETASPVEARGLPGTARLALEKAQFHVRGIPVRGCSHDELGRLRGKFESPGRPGEHEEKQNREESMHRVMILKKS